MSKVFEYFIKFFKNLKYFSWRILKQLSKLSMTHKGSTKSRKISITILEFFTKNTSDFKKSLGNIWKLLAHPKVNESQGKFRWLIFSVCPAQLYKPSRTRIETNFCIQISGSTCRIGTGLRLHIQKPGRTRVETYFCVCQNWISGFLLTDGNRVGPDTINSQLSFSHQFPDKTV